MAQLATQSSGEQVKAPCLFQSGVRFRARPSDVLKDFFARAIGCQRVVFNAKVTEDRLFAAQRRMLLKDDPEAKITTPLDQSYSQFKDDELSPWLSEVPSQILRNGAVRWMNAKQRQLKGLAKAPKLRNKSNFNSVLITKELFRFTDIADPDTGEIKRYLVIGTVADVIDILDFDAHIPYGEPNQITVRKTGHKWWLSFSYAHEAPVDYIERTDEELAYELNGLSEPELRLATLGIDRNVKDNCVATSDGRFFDFYDIQKERMARKEKGKIRYQKKFARQTKGSANSRKTLQRMAAKQEYITHVRSDFSHQTSHALVTAPANDDRAPLLIGIEDLKVKNMVKKPKAKQDPKTGKWLQNGRKAKAALTKKILGACWGTIKTQVHYKAKRNNALVVAVAPHYTSQMCSQCGHTSPDNRHEERFICQRCHHYAHADTNAGLNIRALAIAKVRDNQAVNKVKKSVAFKRKSTGRESSGVPVESCKTQHKAAQ